MKRLSPITMVVFALALASFGGRFAFAAPSFPGATSLTNAADDDNDWILPGKDYANNRYSGLAQITPENVRTLTKAWSTQIADNGQQETSPIIWRGTMYLSTPHDSVLALDATIGKLKWQFPYNPSYVICCAANQGVGIEDGKIFIATQDCRVIAIDATTGKQSWHVNGCPNDRYTSTANSWFHMAAYVYKNKIILGSSGGDNGAIGRVQAFSTSDGRRLWDWHSIPFPVSPAITRGPERPGSMAEVPYGADLPSIWQLIRSTSHRGIRVPIWSTRFEKD